MSLTFGSLFAGIGGFDLGFSRAGMECVWQVEIDPACRRVLAARFPEDAYGPRLWDDVRKCTGNSGQEFRDYELTPVDVVCGGFPCQDLSVAGRRAGLRGKRSGLWWEFHRILKELRPKWAVIENVPGLLSSGGGRDFGAILGSLGELGYGLAYRVLDARWFGVPQRRRRVFVVACLGDPAGAAQVLLEPESLCGDFEESREAGPGSAGAPAACLNSGGGRGGFRTEPGEHLTVGTLTSDHARKGANASQAAAGHFLAHTLRAEGADASEDGPGRGTPLVVIPILEAGARTGVSTDDPRAGIGVGTPGDPMFTLQAGKQHAVAAYQCHGSNVGPMGTLRRGKGDETSGVPFVAFNWQAHEKVGLEISSDTSGPLDCSKTKAVAFNLATVASPEDRSNPQPDGPSPALNRSRGASLAGEGFGVRRLTPTECERLQGFPDGWTQMLSDSARYRCLGNAVAVPCARWIAERLVRLAAEGAMEKSA